MFQVFHARFIQKKSFTDRRPFSAHHLFPSNSHARLVYKCPFRWIDPTIMGPFSTKWGVSYHLFHLGSSFFRNGNRLENFSHFCRNRTNVNEIFAWPQISWTCHT